MNDERKRLDLLDVWVTVVLLCFLAITALVLTHQRLGVVITGGAIFLWMMWATVMDR